LISSFCSFIGAISILVSLPLVIRTRDSSSIPVPLVTANMISSLVWCICGWMLEDPLIAAPNIVGFLS
ncbi:slv, partial [Symbiodinium pilosum]